MAEEPGDDEDDLQEETGETGWEGRRDESLELELDDRRDGNGG